ncbi:MAG TPA: 1,4-alpha-glucan branching protein GlgB [Gemmatimonadaceae bacterium]|jgi:1,4-alpha-glucan branching enzyme
MSHKKSKTRHATEPHHRASGLPLVDNPDLERLLAGDHANPHAILGAHPAVVDGKSGVIVRALIPGTEQVECVLSADRVIPMTREAEGLSTLYATFLPGEQLPLQYTLRFHYPNGSVWERADPYRFLPTLGDVDLHLFNEGTHYEIWKKLGAHPRTIDGVRGTSFALWAPNARRVSVVGDFCGWDGRIYPMRIMGSSGVWELFVPDVDAEALYKFEIVTREHAIRLKTDPFAAKMQQAPDTASIVQADDVYRWNDDNWMHDRRSANLVRSPMSIYEVHLGSWARVPEDGHRVLSYREIAPRLADHVTKLGFTHVELMPVMEHPFYGSWGYQVSGYYAPTSRYGSPDDFRYLVDVLHQRGIGVILDWVPAHFPKDDYALRRFDGTALFEHEDPRLGEHPDWGTLIFNYGRAEVRNFLVANALYWLNEFHADGLRVDAVASMLYLDYSRKSGEWLRNQHGGRENLDAIAFLKQFNEAVRLNAIGCATIAEESTAWPGVTTPVADGGLGFTFKWNMGWMHDTLTYFGLDPIHRGFHQDQITFAMLYEYSERFIMPLSHDEVVHLKGSLLAKMPGDEWQRLANLRLLLAYMFTRPGKKLLFMGSELAPWTEWNHDTSLDWHLRFDPNRDAFENYLSRLANVYRERPAFWRDDQSWDGFNWIDVGDRENSVVSYVRRAGGEFVVVVLNLTPVPRERYRIGVPAAGQYQRLLSSDDAEWGGSNVGRIDGVHSDPSPLHGYGQSIEMTLPPLSAVALALANP